MGEPSVIVVQVYWRPGCPYCRRLRRALTRRGIDAQWHNIWADDAARSFVRQANRGDETVPTAAWTPGPPCDRVVHPADGSVTRS